ncbi:CU044_5270 family protein [Spongiactinospora sp. 9N601]|uniref:CU044_5270 family protein n=1 Tax=Spongiactinospora sp. 9N601 TaxID=3375149 RepID=UPI0037AB4BF0
MTDRIFRDLKPAKLTEITEETYMRRRSADLARAAETSRTETAPRRLRRSFLLTGGVMATGLAAAAAVIVFSGSTPVPAGSSHVASNTPKTSDTADTPDTVKGTEVKAEPINARSFLLAAAATTAKQEPAGSGNYWYRREVTLHKLTHAMGDYFAKVREYDKERKKKIADAKGDQAAVKAAEKEFYRKMDELKKGTLPYAVYETETAEKWFAGKRGLDNRNVREYGDVTFGSPEDEAAWRKAGSPKLTERSAKKRSGTNDLNLIFSIGNPSLTLQNVSKLPTDKKALTRKLDELWKVSPSAADSDKSGYLWQTSQDLLTGPITPGTRSALFKILAEQPGVTAKSQATDALGRVGVALSVKDKEGDVVRLTFDEKTAELLQYEMLDGDKPLLRVAIEQAGWTDKNTERP